jgi:bacterioferritin (cytochrome b1)
MKTKSVELLNKAIREELSAIHLFESLVAEEEKHYDLFDKELANIEKFGANYLAIQSIERNNGN